jgi:acetoin utilization deacetylase AcuC-like enzyme
LSADLPSKKSPLFVALMDYSQIPQVDRAPRERYQMLSRRIQEEGIDPSGTFALPEMVDQRDLLLAHSREYVDDFLNLRATRRTVFGGIPLDASVRDLFLLNAGSTILATQIALETGVCMCIAGGAIHAHRDYAAATCFANDVAIALFRAKVEGSIKRGAVISCDAHQADGVASILAPYPELFTYSIFEADSYPFRKAKSDLDVPLCSHIQDHGYMAALKGSIPGVLDVHKPELVLYVAASDSHQNDFGSDLELSTEGLKERDEYVIGSIVERGIPVAVLMGGASSEDSETLVEIHMNTARLVNQFAHPTKT